VRQCARNPERFDAVASQTAATGIGNLAEFVSFGMARRMNAAANFRQSVEAAWRQFHVDAHRKSGLTINRNCRNHRLAVDEAARRLGRAALRTAEWRSLSWPGGAEKPGRSRP